MVNRVPKTWSALIKSAMEARQQQAARALTTRTQSQYELYRRDELYGLVLELTSKKASHKKSRQFYIDILEEHRIRITTFKFLQLPPELRNAIIYELLRLRLQPHTRGYPRRTVCYPAILRVSKQVHKEAEAVLYGEKIATIRISIRGTRSAHPQRKVEILCQDFPSQPDLLFPRETQSTLGRSFMWPEYLLKFRNVDVSLSFSVDPSSRAAHNIVSTQRLRKSLDIDANHERCGLMSTLGTSIALKRVSLEVVYGGGPPRSTVETQRLEDLLWPIDQLQNIEELTISGLPEGMAGRLKQTVLPADPSQTDVVHTARLCLKQAEALRSLIEETSSDPPVEKLIAGIWNIKQMMHRSEICCRDDHLLLKSHVDDLTKFMRSGAIERVQPQMEEKIERMRAY